MADKASEFLSLIKDHWLDFQKQGTEGKLGTGWMTVKVRGGRTGRGGTCFGIKRPSPWSPGPTAAPPCCQVHAVFAHVADMVTSRGGSRWWNTNFAENAHIAACKTTYRAGNKQVATLQPQMAQNFERRRVMHDTARDLGVEQDHVRTPFLSRLQLCVGPKLATCDR